MVLHLRCYFLVKNFDVDWISAEIKVGLPPQKGGGPTFHLTVDKIGYQVLMGGCHVANVGWFIAGVDGA